jgi:mRNA-degrading endonuclease YafQ of YafQ-DinJ toxin-antitoxin module
LIVQQTTLFGKQKKKLHANQVEALDKVIRAILKNPLIGEQKRGDLSSVRVYKFTMISQECLLAYETHKKQLILLAFGVHENFYRDLKRFNKK